MRKKMIAMLFVLILTLSGCADVSTAPEESDNYELVTETEAAAETESTESSSFSESKESESAKTDTELESNAEVTEYEPVESETSNQNEPVSQGKNQVSETKPAVTESSSAPVEKPEKTEPPAEIPPQTVPEDTKPKTAYDYEFDIETVKEDCIGFGLDMRLAIDSSLTPSNSTWWKPVTASQNNQGDALKQSLERYITFHTELMKSQLLIFIAKQEETAATRFIFSLREQLSGFSLCSKTEGFFYAQNQERTV